MKKHLQILMTGSCLLIASVCAAQPTLTAAGMNPVIGDHFTLNTCSYISPGTSGANQTWDFSSQAANSSYAASVVTPASTPDGASFPVATSAISAASNYEYYKTNSSAWQTAGISQSSVLFSYDNVEDLLRFPFAYTNTYNDSWHCSFTNGLAYSRSGITTITADGYGTLTTPTGTYTNAMRVHMVQNYTDSSYVSGYWFVIPYNNDEYLWYVNGVHYPMATDFIITANGSPLSTQSTYLSGLVGIDEVSGSLGSYSLYPNPVADNLNLDVDLLSGRKVTVSIYNALGAEMEKPSLYQGMTGDNKYRIDVQHLPQGIYMACVSLDGILTSTRQFVISK